MTAFILKQLRKDQKGFTLIELLAVIVILGVIAAIAVPLIGGVIKKSKKDSDMATASQIYQAARLYVTTELDGEAAATKALSIDIKDTLQAKKYLDAGLTLPSTKSEITAGSVKYTTAGDLDEISITSNSKVYTCKGTDVIAGTGECTTP